MARLRPERRGSLTLGANRVAVNGAWRGFLAGLIAGVVASTVLAANIGFSGDTTLGAGTVSVSQCDPDITVEIGSAYSVASSVFTIDAITLGGIDVACAGKRLRIVGYSTTVTALDITTTLGGTASWQSTITITPSSAIETDRVQGTALEIRD